jgi:GTPase Era involved in 16S rRNA processing
MSRKMHISSTKNVSKLQRRNVLLVGKTGGGKSTLGNELIDQFNILEGDPFEVSHDIVLSSVTTEISACTTLLNNRHIVQVVDTPGLFRTCSTYTLSKNDNNMIMKNLSEFIKERVPDGFNIVLYVFQVGLWAHEDQQIFDDVIRPFSNELSSISALVFTGCDGMSSKKRADIITEFIERHPAIALFMQKGIHTVGFPNITRMEPAIAEVYSECRKSDQEHLRQLVDSCDEMKQIHVIKHETCCIT